MPTYAAGRGTTSTGPAHGGRVHLDGVTWRPYGRARPVLAGLDLTVEPGERLLLAGPSGSGKSTALRAIAGLLLTADSGELSGSVTLDGHEPGRTPGAVGLVLQDPGAGTVASTIGRDVAFGLENLGLSRDEMPPRIAGALAEVGLHMSQDVSPATLSGGESQRLALAGALAMEPSVLLLDEPTAMLDAGTAATVRAVVDEVTRRRNLTLVVVEHRLTGWLEVCDRLVVLDATGTVVADGDPATVLDRHGESLAAQGIWVPGVADPEPWPIDLPGLPDGRALDGGPAGDATGPEGVVVAAHGVTVRHRTRRLGRLSRVTTAVRDADLVARAGRTLALVGPSGAGKSSLMGALGGLVPPAEGHTEFAADLRPAARRDAGDVPPHRWSSRDLARVVAWVPQRSATAVLGPTVREDVLVTARALDLDPTTAEARADALLGALGLAHLADVDPRHLSGGEQRRLAVASSVVHAPALLLADEPTVGQDRLTWSAVTGVLAAARDEGSALVVTTHDDGVIATADEVVTLRPPVQDPEPVGPERRPLVSRAGPLALLFVALAVLPLPALIQTWRHGLVVLGVEVLLGGLALLAPGTGRRPTGRLRGVAIRFAPALLAVLGVGWSAWLLGGRDLEVAVGALLRVMCLVVPSAFVAGYIEPERLGDHLAQRLHLPARAVVAVGAALQRLQSFGALWTDLMTTRRVRGVHADHGIVGRLREAVVVTGGLLVGALGQAATLALAMDARGFADAHRRTWAEPAPWRVPDTVAVAAGLLVIGAGVAARILLPG